MRRGLGHAAEDGGQAVQELKAVAAIPGLAPERAAEAERLAALSSSYSDDARGTYGAVLANPQNMPADDSGQDPRHRRRATTEIKTALGKAKTAVLRRPGSETERAASGARSNSAGSR